MWGVCPVDELFPLSEYIKKPTNAENSADDADDTDEIGEGVEAYCVKCRENVEMEDPEPVWTSKGTPGTRGTCPTCGTTVFRMGKTDAHDAMIRPPAVRVEGTTKIATAGGKRRAIPATYINFTGADTEFAAKLARDLENAGVHTWIDTDENNPDGVKWASGVHPALKDSRRMVAVLSNESAASDEFAEAWRFFKVQKKPILLVLLADVPVPDALRRVPRFDFSKDYRTAFRELLLALGE
jgi:hypothetical protein